MKKLLFFILLFSSFLNADILHNVSMLSYKNKCIYNNYYNKGGRFYYQFVDNNKSYSTSSRNYLPSLINGYKFDTNTSVCSPEAWRILGMTIEDYHFLEALTGLLFGFTFMIFTIYLFVTVGGKR